MNICDVAACLEERSANGICGFPATHLYYAFIRSFPKWNKKRRKLLEKPNNESKLKKIEVESGKAQTSMVGSGVVLCAEADPTRAQLSSVSTLSISKYCRKKNKKLLHFYAFKVKLLAQALHSLLSTNRLDLSGFTANFREMDLLARE